NKRTQCLVCGKSFGRRDNFKRHMRRHTGENLYTCPHMDCNRSFTRSDQLSRHEVMYHSTSIVDAKERDECS
ncbi:hypothetical protein K493DRAFT_184773, partial [Basidiobolus meristosporus CBS 931.73]